MVLSFEQAGDLLDTLAESFPEALFDGLNGGVNFQEEATIFRAGPCRDEDSVPGR